MLWAIALAQITTVSFLLISIVMIYRQSNKQIVSMFISKTIYLYYTQILFFLFVIFYISNQKHLIIENFVVSNNILIGSLLAVYIYISLYKFVFCTNNRDIIKFKIVPYIQISVSFFVITVLVFAACYNSLYQFDNKYFFVNATNSTYDAVYYSIITATTLGYGDIVPIGYVPRWLSAIHVLYSVFFIATIVAVSVSQQSGSGSKGLNSEANNDSIK